MAICPRCVSAVVFSKMLLSPLAKRKFAFSKKEGEQQAAKMALITYGVLNKDQYNTTDIFYTDWTEINNTNESYDIGYNTG